MTQKCETNDKCRQRDTDDSTWAYHVPSELSMCDRSAIRTSHNTRRQRSNLTASSTTTTATLGDKPLSQIHRWIET